MEEKVNDLPSLIDGAIEVIPRGNPAIDVFYVDELIAKGLGFALQIRQHPISILLVIRLLSRLHARHTRLETPFDVSITRS
jgi:hypothetical protein